MSLTNELRVFISSTFRDLQEEREYLVKKVFPEIRALCRQRGITFTEIDLRWGLTDEQSALGTIIRTCLEEIDRCRPYFIGIVGDRYGWAPGYHEVAMDPELITRYPWIEDAAIDEVSITEMEFIHGTHEFPNSDLQSAFFYRRSNVSPAPDDEEKLNRLLDRATTQGYSIQEFTTPDSLGEQVLADIRNIIDGFWPEDKQPTPLERTRRSHAAFAESRRRAYIGQPAHLKLFDAWRNSGETPLVVAAESGLGKSSLVAWLTDRFRSRNPDALVIEHYVGAGLASGTTTAIMRHCIEEINERFSFDEEIPTNPVQLERAFPNSLYRAERAASDQGCDVLIVLDAVNQLDEIGQRLRWLPESIPPGIHLIVSTTPGPACDELDLRKWQRLEVIPLDDVRMRSSIVVRYLADFHKSISARQLERISSDPKASSPLYLRVVAEELRLHGEHETLDEIIDQYRGASDLDDVFQRVLERIEHDFPGTMLPDLLTSLWASRHGLSETDLLGIIRANRLELSRILLAFDYHLLRREGNLDFFHDYLRRAVERRYLSGEDALQAARNRIITHFAADFEPVLLDASFVEGLFLSTIAVAGTHEFALVRELAYQYRQNGRKENLVHLLSSVPVLVMTILGSARTEFYENWRELSDEYSVADACLEGIAAFRRLQPDPRVVPDVLMTVSNVLITMGQLETVESLLREAHDLMSALNDPPGLVRSTRSLAVILTDRGSYDEALTLLAKARRGAEDADDRSTLSSVLDDIATVHIRRNEYPEAIEFGNRALELGREHSSPRDIAGRLHGLANAYSGANEKDTALDLYNQALQINESIGNRQWMAYNIMSIALIEQDRGELESAATKLERMVEILDALGDRVARGIALGNLGTVYSQMKRNADALRCLDHALDIHREFGFHHGLTFWTYQKASVLRRIVHEEQHLPEFLTGHVTAIDRASILRQALELANECIEISTRMSRPHDHADALKAELEDDLG